MVGINLNGVVHGRELRSVANEIFNKSKSHNPSASAKADVVPKNINENPFKDFSNGIVEFIPQETKTAKAGFEQSTLQIDQGIKKTVNVQAAIDKYSLFASKESGISENFANKVSGSGLEINSASKDKKGKNRFAFLSNLPKDQKEPLNEDQLRSIFDTIAKKN